MAKKQNTLHDALQKKRNNSNRVNPHLESAIEAVTEEDTQRCTFDLPDSQYRAFKMKCLENQISMSDAIRSLIDHYLNK